jgi:hypothetical protein
MCTFFDLTILIPQIANDNSRFGNVTGDEAMEALDTDSSPKNTLCNQRWATKIWDEFSASAWPNDNVSRDALLGDSMQKILLSRRLIQFFKNVRNQEGAHYQPRTIRTLMSSLQRTVNLAIQSSFNNYYGPDER